MAKKTAVSEYLARIGRKGGQAKGLKGLAAMPEERQKEIREKAAAARRKQAASARKKKG